MAYIIPFVLPTTGITPNKRHISLKPLSNRPGLYTVLQKAIILNTCRIVG